MGTCVEKQCIVKYNLCMQLIIPIRALSVNQAWAGQRFKTPKYKQFEKDFSSVVPFSRTQNSTEELFVKYVFYVKNYGLVDVDNLIKQTNDMLCKRRYLADDRYIKAIYCQKEKVTDIVLYEDRGNVL